MEAKQGVRIGWPFHKLKDHPLLECAIRHLGLDGESVHVGWGLRPSGRAALKAAAQDGCRLPLLEDAFVRSIRPGKSGAIHGVLADSKGMHYDIHGNSDLLDALESGKPQGWMHSAAADPDAMARTLTRFRETGASKYNSWVVDSRGIYFAPTTPSDLEVLLNDGFSAADLHESAQLLQSVRKAEPDAFLIFKAHPDHVAGARHGKVLPPGYDGLSDPVVTEGNVLDWLDLCDEVHTMNSSGAAGDERAWHLKTVSKLKKLWVELAR